MLFLWSDFHWCFVTDTRNYLNAFPGISHDHHGYCQGGCILSVSIPMRVEREMDKIFNQLAYAVFRALLKRLSTVSVGSVHPSYLIMWETKLKHFKIILDIGESSSPWFRDFLQRCCAFWNQFTASSSYPIELKLGKVLVNSAHYRSASDFSISSRGALVGAPLEIFKSIHNPQF